MNTIEKLEKKSENIYMQKLKSILPVGTNFIPLNHNKVPTSCFSGKKINANGIEEFNQALFDTQKNTCNIMAYHSNNYGVRCEKLVCIDVDLYKEGHGDIPNEYKNTFTQKTGSGGFHYIYLRDARMEHWKSESNIINGLNLDIKIGKNSYFVGSGSQNNKGIYSCVKPIKPVKIPDGLFNLINGYYTGKARPVKKSIDFTITQKINRPIHMEYSELKKYIDLCPISYFTDHYKWLRLAWIMNYENHSEEAKDLWIAKSREIPKYKDKPLAHYNKIWYKSNVGISEEKQLKIGTLIEWLQQDKLYFKEEIKEEIKKNNINEYLLSGTHFDLCEIAIKLIGDNYIYCEGTDEIYTWAKTHWKIISKENLNNKLMISLSKLYKKKIQFSLETNNNLGFKELSKVFLLCKNTNHIKCVGKIFIYRIKQVEITDLNKNDYEFVFDNCCINLETGEIAEPQKNKYATISAGYDYKKSSEEQQTELKNVLSKIISNDNVRKFTLLLLSTALVGIPIAKFIVFLGNGRNGKGTLNELMRLMMGNYYYKLNHKTLIKGKGQDRQDINNIKFKRYLLTTEPDHEGKLDSNLMKDICSDDKIINARALYKTDSRVPKKNTLVMECNNIPLLDNCNGQDALSERLNIIEFMSTFVSKNDKRLLLENSKRKYYIANSKYVSEKWTESVKIALFDILLEFCIKFIKDKSIINDKPIEIIRTNSNYFLSSNEIKEWVIENYHIARKDDITNKEYMRSKDILNDYKASELYANSSSKDKKKVLPNKWKKLMDEWFPEYFYKRKKINGNFLNSILFSFVKKEIQDF